MKTTVKLNASLLHSLYCANSLNVIFFVCVNTHLISGVDHVGFGTFIRAVRVGELHVEQVEDETVKSGTQTVTEAPDSCNHPLDHTYRHTDTQIQQLTRSGKNLRDATIKQTLRITYLLSNFKNEMFLLVGL